MKISAKLPLSQPPYTLQTSFEFLENILDFHHQKDQPLPPARDQNRWREENERRRMFWGLRVWLDTCEFFINHDNINVQMQQTLPVSFWTKFDFFSSDEQRKRSSRVQACIPSSNTNHT